MLWTYSFLIATVVMILIPEIIALPDDDEVELPKEILDCLDEAKTIVPKFTAYYNDCAKKLAYNMEDLPSEAGFSKLTAVDSCFDKARSEDKEGSIVVDKCNKAVENLSDAQRTKVARIIFELESASA